MLLGSGRWRAVAPSALGLMSVLPVSLGMHVVDKRKKFCFPAAGSSFLCPGEGGGDGTSGALTFFQSISIKIRARSDFNTENGNEHVGLNFTNETPVESLTQIPASSVYVSGTVRCKQERLCNNNNNNHHHHHPQTR